MAGRIPMGRQRRLLAFMLATSLQFVGTAPAQDWPTRPRELGATVVAPERRSPEYLQKFVASEIEKWAPMIRSANVTAD